jgi:hypothetical protein
MRLLQYERQNVAGTVSGRSSHGELRQILENRPAAALIR